MPAAVQNLNFEWQACICHIFHNAALKGNQTLEEDPTGQRIFEFVTTFATALRQSSTRAELFEKYQLDVIQERVQASCSEDDNVDNDDESDDEDDVQEVRLAFMYAQAGSFSKPPICPLKTVKPVKTCWRSQYKAVGYVYQLQKATKLYIADVNAGIDPLQPGDLSVMATLLDVMGPIADVGFARAKSCDLPICLGLDSEASSRSA